MDNELIGQLKEKYSRLMQEQLANQSKGHDAEGNHSLADELLCGLLIELGFDEVVELYNALEKWYA